jgi:hypothetical protein
VTGTSEGPQAANPASAMLERVATIARALAEARTLDDVLQRIVDLGVRHLDRCDGVSLMLVQRRGRVSTPVYSSDIARDTDTAQYETGQGPCLTAMDTRRTVVIDDMADEARWPGFSERALALGVRSMCSFRLFLEADTMGALNFYASTADAFLPHDVLLGEVFASHAAVALRSAITAAGLESALASRDRIGQAKGVIMSRERITGEAAFDRLRALSERQNRPLSEVADDVVRTGEAPRPEPTRRERHVT